MCTSYKKRKVQLHHHILHKGKVHQKIGGDDIEYYVKKAMMNLLHENIDVHSKIFIAEFPMDGIQCIEKLQ